MQSLRDKDFLGLYPEGVPFRSLGTGAERRLPRLWAPALPDENPTGKRLAVHSLDPKPSNNNRTSTASS